MIRTYTAPMLTKRFCLFRLCRCNLSRSGFTLTESMVALLIASLILAMATINLSGVYMRSSFKAKVYDMVSTLQMAADSAAKTGKRYEVIIDLDLQGYLLREITTPELSQVLEDEIIVEEYLSENCWIDYVIFDDGDYTSDGQAKFRAGSPGWQYGGKIVLLDNHNQAYSIVVNRLNRTIELKEGDVTFLAPKRIDEISF